MRRQCHPYIEGRKKAFQECVPPHAPLGTVEPLCNLPLIRQWLANLQAGNTLKGPQRILKKELYNLSKFQAWPPLFTQSFMFSFSFNPGRRKTFRLFTLPRRPVAMVFR